MKKILLSVLISSYATLACANPDLLMAKKVMDLAGYKGFVSDYLALSSAKKSKITCGQLQGSGNQNQGYFIGETICSGVDKYNKPISVTIGVSAGIAINDQEDDGLYHEDPTYGYAYSLIKIEVK